jgi:hypothetical protein
MMDKKNLVQFNVNHNLWARLTDKGLETLLKQRNKYTWPKTSISPVTTDDIKKWYSVTDDGYFHFQMHHFMEVFGNDVSSDMFETTVYFDHRELVWPVQETQPKPELEKYITTGIVQCGTYGKNLKWWDKDDAPTVIAILEQKHPGYEFHQFVTSPGNGGYREYAIMKLKDK